MSFMMVKLLESILELCLIFNDIKGNFMAPIKRRKLELVHIVVIPVLIFWSRIGLIKIKSNVQNRTRWQHFSPFPMCRQKLSLTHDPDDRQHTWAR